MVIVQSGGPTTVSNTCLAAAVAAEREGGATGAQVLGARGGLAGLLAEELIDLAAVSNWPEIAGSPGAALGSSRYRPSESEIGRIVEILSHRDVHHLIMIGGNGTMSAAARLSAAAGSAGYELAVSGIPDTIDNDVPGTDLCLGFASCARYSAQTVLDVAADVRTLPTPVSIVEVMGRNTGWVAAATAVARVGEEEAPHRIFVPEVPIRQADFLEAVQRRFESSGWVVLVVAEGVVGPDGNSIAGAAPTPGVNGFGGAMVGDVGPALATLVTTELGLRARTEKPGLAARAAPHLAADADLAAATAAGRFAVSRLAEGESHMVGLCVEPDGGVLCRAVALPKSRSGGSSADAPAADEPSERQLPAAYLLPDGTGPSRAFRDYVGPLVGQLRRPVRL